jgi:hypothetical protein
MRQAYTMIMESASGGISRALDEAEKHPEEVTSPVLIEQLALTQARLGEAATSLLSSDKDSVFVAATGTMAAALSLAVLVFLEIQGEEDESNRR